MSSGVRKPAPSQDPLTPLDDEGSAIRRRDVTGSACALGRSSTRTAQGSLDERLEQKMHQALRLVQALPTADARVRLLYVSIVRRDELLLDGVLADLSQSAAEA